MNNRKRMYQTNQKIRKLLKSQGYREITPFLHSRFQKDIFGWDAVCKDPWYNKEKEDRYDVVWLQFKTGRCSVEDKDNLAKFCEQAIQRGMLCELIPYRIKKKDGKGSYTKHKIRITAFPSGIVNEYKTI